MAERYDSTRPDPTIRVEHREPEAEDLAAIRADIRQTRERMSHTVEDIGYRLNPDRLKQQLKDNVHEATIGKAENMARMAVDRVDDTRHSIMDTIRDNPIPAAMVGIGLGWMLFNGRRDDHVHHRSAGYGYADRPVYPYDAYARGVVEPGLRGYPDREEEGLMDRVGSTAADAAETVRDRAEDLAHRAEDRVTEIAYDARDTVSHAADRAQSAIGHTASRARSMATGLARDARHGTHRVEDRFQDALHNSPLAVGAAVMAIGLAAGLAAPATRRESELMGPLRDDVVHRARHAAEDAADRVQNVASKVASEVESATRNVIDDVEDSAQSAAERVEGSARQAAREEGLL
jgi:gas vesicle protein/ElaB/YqjD/DUF883 family membrane-anchored ribosome-binding protein